jgi:hypothetical protein
MFYPHNFVITVCFYCFYFVRFTSIKVTTLTHISSTSTDTSRKSFTVSFFQQSVPVAWCRYLSQLCDGNTSPCARDYVVQNPRSWSNLNTTYPVSEIELRQFLIFIFKPLRILYYVSRILGDDCDGENRERTPHVTLSRTEMLRLCAGTLSSAALLSVVGRISVSLEKLPQRACEFTVSC